MSSSNDSPAPLLNQLPCCRRRHQIVTRGLIREKVSLVHKSWPMFLRRCILTYGFFTASLLIIIELLSFSVDVFYTFQETDTDESLSPFHVLGRKVVLLGLLILIFLVASRLVSKCVDLVLDVVWHRDQYLVLSRKVASFVEDFYSFGSCCCCSGLKHMSQKNRDDVKLVIDIIVQAFLVGFLEILPILATIILVLSVPDAGFGAGSYTRPFELFVILVSVCALVIAIIWFLGEVIENFKRLFAFLFCCGKVFVFAKATKDRRSNRISRSRLARTLTRNSLRQVQRNENKEEKEEETYPHHSIPSPEIVDVEDGIPSINSEEDTEDPVVRYPSPMIDDLVSSSYVDDDDDKERNCWVLAMFCCCWWRIPKLGCSFRSCWIAGISIFLIAAISILSSFFLWRVALLFAIVGIVLIAILAVDWIIWIPKHRPMNERLYALRRKNCLSRLVLLIEEVYYCSPAHVFTGVKWLSFILIVAMIAVSVFELTSPTVFILPLINLILLLLVYALRFNLKPLIRMVSQLWKKRKESDEGAVSEETHLFEMENEREERGGERHVYSEESSILRHISVLFYVFSVLAWFIAFIVCVFVFFNASVGLFAILLFLLLCCVVFERYHRAHSTVRGVVFVFFISMVSLVWLVGYSSYLAKLNHIAPTEVHVDSRLRQLGRDVMKVRDVDFATHHRYGICESTWPAGVHGPNSTFDAIDLGVMSYLAYWPKKEDLEELLPIYLPGCEDCEVREVWNESVVFVDFFSPSRNLSIIAVRGTATAQDIVQDAYIWKEIGLLQISSIVSPLLTTMGESLSGQLIYYISRIETLLVPPVARYYSLLNDYVEKRKLEVDRLLLTGHSLGGGVAKIVGSLQNVTAVSYAAPGLTYSAYKLGFTPEDVNRIATTVKPHLDVVSDIDCLGGAVQHVECLFQNLADCHSLYGIIDSLILVCGDQYGRWVPADPFRD